MKHLPFAKYKHIRFCVTNACPNNCSFCYRHRLDRPINSVNMSRETALAAIKFIYEKLNLEDSFMLMPWGGEPMIRFKLLKELAEMYPQIKFHTNTSGETIDEEVYNWFKTTGHNFTLVLSLGNSYEKYGGIRQKMEALPWTMKIVKERNFSINLTVTNPDKLVEDFEYLREQGYENVAVQQVLGIPYTKDQLKQYADGLLFILEKYRNVGLKEKYNPNPMFKYRNMAEKSLVWYKEFGPATFANKDNVCTSGIDKLFIDTDGGIWQCDGSYLNQEGKLGDIYNGIDADLVEKRYEEHKESLNRNFSPCNECEIKDVCSNTLCLATNKSKTGSHYQPYPGFCDFQKMMTGVFKQYVENRKKELNVKDIR